VVDRLDHVRQALKRRCGTIAGGLLAVVLACAPPNAQVNDSARADSVTRAARDSINRAQPGYVVDSIFPIAEEIRRFNAGVVPVDSLESPARTRNALVMRFAAALAQHDTAALTALLITRAEFGYLVFPESPYTQPPYKTKPGVIWTQLSSETQRGLARLLQRVGGTGVQVSALRCDERPERQGQNKYWRNCSVLKRDTSQRATRMRLFGPILERNGRAKFLSYSTDY
jgi:hypothetical protein